MLLQLQMADYNMIGTFLDYIANNKPLCVITEGVSKGGLEAELLLYNTLKKYHKLPKTQAKPAGFDAHSVDLSFLDKKNQTHLLEVKNDLPDFGQIELKWTNERKWHFKDYNSEDPDPAKAERAKIVDELRKDKVEAKLNQHWSRAPKLYTKNSYAMTLRDRAYDKQTFVDHYFDVPSTFINRYYRSKGVNYINIVGRNYGLYHFGEDPAKIGCPMFKPKVCKLRARIKPRDSRSNPRPTGYGFLGALRVGSLSPSPITFTNPDDIIQYLGGHL